MKKFILVLTTVPNEKTGQQIARALVEERLAACVTVSPAAQSFYWWEGRIMKEREHILIIKTKASAYDELEARLKGLHPYDVPEFIALPIERGSKRYLAWVDKETKSPRL
jgi:periplasmic divalent cation tolerance protein